MNFLSLVKNVGVYSDTDTSALLTLANPNRQITRLKQIVNDAYNTVWLALHPSNEDAETSTTVNTVANQDYVNIPFNQVGMVLNGNNPPYRILPWLEYEVNYRRNGTNNQVSATLYGEPNVASIYQKRLYLYPIPDSTYPLTIRGNLSFTPLVNDTDEPLLRDEFQIAIQQLGIALELGYQGDSMAQDAMQKANDLLKVVRKNMRGHKGMPPRIMTEDEYTNAMYRSSHYADGLY